MTRSPDLPSRFRITEALASGSRRTLYRATDDLLARPVVLDLRRGRRPLRLTALHHPGIVALYDAGRTEERTYLVKQYVDGPLLTERVHARAVTAEELFDVGARLASVLGYLHDRRVVHGAVRARAVRFDRHGCPHLLGDVHEARRDGSDPDEFADRAAEDVRALGLVLVGCLPPPRGPRRAVAAHWWSSGTTGRLDALPDSARTLLTDLVTGRADELPGVAVVADLLAEQARRIRSTGTGTEPTSSPSCGQAGVGPRLRRTVRPATTATT